MYLDPYLVGIIRGDGSASKRKDGAYAVWVDQAEKNHKIIEEVKLRFQRLGLKVFFYKYYARQDKAWKYRALVYSKELFTRLKSVFRNIKAYIDKLSDGEAKQFIAGVLDAEGTVTDRIVIYNKSMVLLRAIQNKLDKLGIFNSHIYKFGVVHGLQIYRRESLKSMVGEIPAVKLRSSTIALSG
jgi:LAGLIDADG DNA endonuclease family protein